MSVETDLAKWADLTRKQINRASARALNRAATTTRAAVSQEVREEVSLKAADIKNVVTLRKAQGAEDMNSQAAYVIIKDKPVPLAQYAASPRNVKTVRGKRVGVTVKVKGERKLVAQGFLATVGAGHLGVFTRRRGGRLPIRERFGPSVAQIVQGLNVLRRLMDISRDAFVKNFRSELNYQASKTQGQG